MILQMTNPCCQKTKEKLIEEIENNIDDIKDKILELNLYAGDEVEILHYLDQLQPTAEGTQNQKDSGATRIFRGDKK